jgi:hypothetical protein
MKHARMRRFDALYHGGRVSFDGPVVMLDGMVVAESRIPDLWACSCKALCHSDPGRVFENITADSGRAAADQ